MQSIGIIAKTKRVQESIHEDRFQQYSEDGFGARKSMGVESLRHGTTTKRRFSKALGKCRGKDAFSLALA